MKVTPVKTRVFREREDLVCFIEEHLPKIPDRSIVVIASKIVSLAEGRTVVAKNKRDMKRIIAQESDAHIRTKYVELAMKKGLLLPNAGVDESNGNGKLVLLPKDSFEAARLIRNELMRIYTVKHLGVIISDSLPMPLRKGVVGIALGYAGFSGVKDYKGKQDLFGRKFRFASVNIADSLATSAALLMGEGGESQPLTIITDVPVEFRDIFVRAEINVRQADDVYMPLLKQFKNNR